MLGLLVISVLYTLYLTKGIHLGTETFIPFVKNYVLLPMSLYIPFVIFIIGFIIAILGYPIAISICCLITIVRSIYSSLNH